MLLRRARVLVGVPLLGGCATPVDGASFCREVGYAIASRTEACTGDAAVAEARFRAFEGAYTCVEIEADTGVPYGEVAPQDLYACPLAIRNLPCELALRYGDDLDAWLTASPVCALVVEAP